MSIIKLIFTISSLVLDITKNRRMVKRFLVFVMKKLNLKLRTRVTQTLKSPKKWIRKNNRTPNEHYVMNIYYIIIST